MTSEPNDLQERKLRALHHVHIYGFTEDLFGLLRKENLIKQIKPRHAGPWVLTDAGLKLIEGER